MKIWVRFDVIILDDFFGRVESFNNFPEAISTQKDIGIDKIVTFAKGIRANNHCSLNNFLKEK